MSYEKQTWQSGDVITAAKMNHIEDGIAGGGVLAVQSLMEGDKATLTSTWQEIHDAAASGKIVIIYYTEGAYEVGVEIATHITRIQGKYAVYPNFILPGDGTPYACDSPADYPYAEST